MILLVLPAQAENDAMREDLTKLLHAHAGTLVQSGPATFASPALSGNSDAVFTRGGQVCIQGLNPTCPGVLLEAPTCLCPCFPK